MHMPKKWAYSHGKKPGIGTIPEEIHTLDVLFNSLKSIVFNTSKKLKEFKNNRSKYIKIIFHLIKIINNIIGNFKKSKYECQN